MSLDAVSESIPIATDTDGVVRVGGTRVSLDTIVSAYRNGATAESIADDYPSLLLSDIYTVIGYYLRHQGEVDEYLKRRRQQAEQVRQENESRFNPIGIRERLLARRHAQG
jgi:uncharacterized protein (DUF433 family)